MSVQAGCGPRAEKVHHRDANSGRTGVHTSSKVVCDKLVVCGSAQIAGQDLASCTAYTANMTGSAVSVDTPGPTAFGPSAVPLEVRRTAAMSYLSLLSGSWTGSANVVQGSSATLVTFSSGGPVLAGGDLPAFTQTIPIQISVQDNLRRPRLHWLLMVAYL
jgi:hypothetical protein